MGFQYGPTRAFLAYNNGLSHRTIEDAYVDGVVITHGTVKQHIWTFAAAFSEDPFYSATIQCPCTDLENTNTSLVPPFLGDDYFCETAVTTGSANSNPIQFFQMTHSGMERTCGPESTCCEFNNPPYFCKHLSEPTVDDIEVRICAEEDTQNEDVPIELIEIFIQ